MGIQHDPDAVLARQLDVGQEVLAKRLPALVAVEQDKGGEVGKIDAAVEDERRLHPTVGDEAGGQSSLSTSIAMPWPPPTHIVSRPIVPSIVSRSFSSVHMIRAPVMP